MNTLKLIRKLSRYYPKSLALGYDHPGLQTGKLKEDSKSILLCLDFDRDVLDEMKARGLLDKVDLIVTHHPFIFGTKYRVFKGDPLKEELARDIDSLNIPIYSFHTNFDGGKMGMNDALAEALELVDITPLSSEPMARGGRLVEPMVVEDFARYSERKLDVDYGLLLPYGKKVVSSVAIIGGGGWYGYRAAIEDGYDIFISGDIPHHGRRDIVARHYDYLDLPHEIERIFMKQMKKMLLSFDSNLAIYMVDQEKLPTVIEL
jgi:dinuclear metal center YbgI/SA1388 family protein